MKSPRFFKAASIGLIIFLLSLSVQAQHGFNYQAVARDASGMPLANEAMTIRISIRSDGPTGELFWQEEHSVQTNALGLFTLTVGDPMAAGQTGSAGSFDNMDWAANDYFLYVETKGSGDFVEMGGAPIQTVPRAKYADAAGGASSNFSVQPNDVAKPGEALFEVRRSDGQPVFAVYEDSVMVYVSDEAKGKKGGFAVGGYNRASKGMDQEFLRISPDSIRMYVNEEVEAKGKKGGFAVGGYNRASKGEENLYFNLSPSTTAEVIEEKSQILFYPVKDAFMAGTIHVGSPDSVGQNSTSLGFRSVAMGQYSQAFGYQSVALGSQTTAIGREAKAYGDDSYAFGSGAMARGQRSFAFGSVGIDTAGNVTGEPTLAQGDYSLALGMGAQATEDGAMSIGTKSLAEGWQSVAIGSGTSASGSYATGIGYRSQATGYKSIAIGAHYSYSLFIPTRPGKKGSTTATDSTKAYIYKPPYYYYFPRVITAYNRAIGDYSISIGNGNYSSDGGMALGTYNYAYNQGSVALGVSNISRKAYSFTAGYNNEATGYYSMALGENLTSQAQNSFVIGRFNELVGDTAEWRLTDPLFQIGNGSASDARHDAFRVDKNGNVTIETHNSYHGLEVYTSADDEFLGTYTHSFLSEVNRLKDGHSYYSGVFRDKGSLGTYYGMYADIRAGGAIDVAEYIYDSRGDTEAADVVVADPGKKESVLKSSGPYQTSVLGVVSTKPHMTMGMELVVDEESGEPIPGVKATRLALTGRVPVKISEENGPVEPGDLLTTSSIPGHAMKWSLLDVNQATDFDELKSMLAENERRRNAIIGKALSSSSSGEGTVMVLISLQ